MALNVPLLRRIQEEIVKENGTRFFMREIMRRAFLSSSDHYYDDGDHLTPFPPCATVACICGWAALLTDPQASGYEWRIGSVALGLRESSSPLEDRSSFAHPFNEDESSLFVVAAWKNLQLKKA